MKLGIMQPYFFPYIGYWQLIHCVDKYVIYDDVNFIKGGWINRNRILSNGNPQYFNIQMKGASSFKKIREISVDTNIINKKKLLKTLDNCYSKAPWYHETMELMSEIILTEEENLGRYLEKSIRIICGRLGIGTEIIVSSDIHKDNALKGEDKVIDICKACGADVYINAIGGKALYSFENFKRNGIKLLFLESGKVEYPQFGNLFVENLSIIDLLMFNSREQIRAFLDQYKLTGEKDI